jgi:hypothetical protein
MFVGDSSGIAIYAVAVLAIAIAMLGVVIAA